MKKILLLLFVAGVFCGCKFHEVPVTNSGEYSNISYYGYNAILKNIDLINTEDGYAELTLLGGENSFQHIEYNFNNTTYIKSINISFLDTLSKPLEQCYFSLSFFSKDGNGRYSNYETIYNYKEGIFLDFKESQNFTIDKEIDGIQLFFSSNNSEFSKRVIKLYKIEAN